MIVDTELTPTAERIADAAQDLIQHLGYNGFSFDHISKMVGIRKPSIHYHFHSKSELGATLVRRYTNQFSAKLKSIQQSEKNARGRLNAFAELFEVTYQQNRKMCVCGMLAAESSSLDDSVNLEVQRFFQLILTWLTDVFEEGLESGNLSSRQSASSLAEALLSMLEGSMLVGRCLTSSMGPAHLSELFLSSLTG